MPRHFSQRSSSKQKKKGWCFWKNGEGNNSNDLRGRGRNDERLRGHEEAAATNRHGHVLPSTTTIVLRTPTYEHHRKRGKLRRERRRSGYVIDLLKALLWYETEQARNSFWLRGRGRGRGGRCHRFFYEEEEAGRNRPRRQQRPQEPRTTSRCSCCYDDNSYCSSGGALDSHTGTIAARRLSEPRYPPTLSGARTTAPDTFRPPSPPTPPPRGTSLFRTGTDSLRGRLFLDYWRSRGRRSRENHGEVAKPVSQARRPVYIAQPSSVNVIRRGRGRHVRIGERSQDKQSDISVHQVVRGTASVPASKSASLTDLGYCYYSGSYISKSCCTSCNCEPASSIEIMLAPPPPILLHSTSLDHDDGDAKAGQRGNYN